MLFEKIQEAATRFAALLTQFRDIRATTKECAENPTRRVQQARLQTACQRDVILRSS